MEKVSDSNDDLQCNDIRIDTDKAASVKNLVVTNDGNKKKVKNKWSNRSMFTFFSTKKVVNWL